MSHLILADRLARNLRRLIDAREWSQARLARESGVSPATVVRVMVGSSAATELGTVESLAVALDVDPATLLIDPSRPPAADLQTRLVELRGDYDRLLARVLDVEAHAAENQKMIDTFRAVFVPPPAHEE